MTRGNHIYWARNLPRLYGVRLFTSLEMLDINHWFSNLNGHGHPQEGLFTQRLLGAHSEVDLRWSLSIYISSKVPGDADSTWPRDRTWRNTARGPCYSEYGPWTSSINISGMLVRNATAQAPHQIHHIMVCPLTSSFGDSFTRWSLRNTDPVVIGKGFGEFRIGIIQNWVQVSGLLIPSPVTLEGVDFIFFLIFFNPQFHLRNWDDYTYKVVVKIKCDNICKVHIISSVVKWCPHSFLCEICPVKPLKTTVWRKYLKFSLKCFHMSCFEKSYFHSIELGCPHCVILSVIHSCRYMAWIKFVVSQPPGLTSESECVHERLEGIDSFWGWGVWGNTQCLFPP